MKKDKLYTVNKWNKPKFAQDVDRIHNNIFDGFGSSYMQHGNANPYDWSNYGYTGSFGPSSMYPNNTLVPYASMDTSGISNEIHSIANPEIKAPDIKAVDTKPKANAGSALNKAAQIGSAALSMYGSARSLATPQGKGKLSGIRNQVSDLNNYRISTTNLDAIDQVASSFKPLKTNYKWKDFYADGGWLERPYTYDAGGRMVTGTLGNTFNGAATAATASGGNPYAIAAGAVVGLGSGIIGSIIGHNRAKGMAREANRLSTDANNGMYYKIDSAVDNAKRYNALNLGLNTPYAYGGLIDLANDGMGAMEYGLMSDYLNMKNNQAQNKGNMVGYLGNISSEPMTFAKGGKIHINPKNKGKLTETARRTGKSFEELAHSKNPLTRKRAQFALNARHFNHKRGYGGLLDNNDTLFALGGDLQANGGDYSDGLVQINAGQSHEENPYDGVQMGIAPDNTPNLVEEGETIFNDYVFSDRIHPTKDVLKKFHMYSKGGKLTYADVSKKLEKEASERPNDPISRASLKKMLEQLAEAQENQKAEEEANRAMKAFEALSPEEQQQVLAQIAAQQAQNGGEEGVENGGEEVPVDENGNPVDVSAQQQPAQLAEEEIAAQQNGEEGVVGAYGGELNHKYLTGGELMKAIAGYLNFSTESQLNDWLNKNNIKDFDWDKAARTGDLSGIQEAITKDSPRFAYALNKGFNFNPAVTGPVYNMDTFINDTLSPYIVSKDSKYNKGLYNYSADDYSKYIGNYKTVGDYEKGDNNYKNFTSNVLDFINSNPQIDENGNLTGDFDTPENRQYLNYFRALQKGLPSSSNIYQMVGTGAGNLFNTVGNLSAADLWSKARGDGNWGLLHFTPTVNTPTSDVTNIFDDNGHFTELYNTDGYTDAKTPYTWKDANGNQHTLNFYTKEAADNNSTTKEPEKIPYLTEMSEAETLLPNFLGAGLWAAGVGRPDTSGLDAAVDYSRGLSPLADYRGIGNYRRYVPKDVNAPLNDLYSYSRGTARSLRNNNGSVGALMTGLSNNAYNTMAAAAKTQGSVDQINEAQKKDVFDSNQKTDMFNADAFNKAALANAQLQDSNRRYTAELMANAAAQKMAADTSWYSTPYGMLSEIASVRNARDLQNRRFNPVIAMANAGIVGAPNEEVNVLVGNRGKKSKGGRLNKKGLTF